MKRLLWVLLGVGIGLAGAVGFYATAQAGSEGNIYGRLDLFGSALEAVRAKYVRPVPEGELIDAAIEGMLTHLDPHSNYFNPKEFSDFQVQATGEFGGVGIEVSTEEQLIKVISPIDDTPAARAGLKAGDYVAAIDGVPVQGTPLDQAIDKMRGKPGTKVVLTILRKGAKKPFDVTLVRAIIRVERVKWRREGDVGYIRLTGFNDSTDADLEKAVRALKKQIGADKIKGYVLDLRNNPGGLFEQAISVADEFLDAGEVVSTRGRQSEDTHRYNARKGDIIDGKKLVVLINGGSASSSEIVAGALQDQKRAQLIGLKSFGKGSVQTVIPLGNSGSAIKLTTARYYTPSGRSIQADGIAPNIWVAQGDEDQLTKLERPSEADLPGHLVGNADAKKKTVMINRPAPGKKYDDFQLAYALDILRGTKTVATVQKAETE